MELETFGPLLVVRFRGPPDLATLTALAQEEERIAATGQKVVFLGILENGLGAPEPDARAELSRRSARMQENTRAVHWVLPGKGISATTQRALLSAMTLVISKGVPSFVHASVDEALAAMKAGAGDVPPQAWEAAARFSERRPPGA